MFGLGVSELIIIALIIIIFFIFGTKKLPQIGKNLGSAVREIRNIENELTGSGSKDANSKTPPIETDKSESSIETIVSKKLLRQLPGVKKVMHIKDKVDKVKEIIK